MIMVGGDFSVTDGGTLPNNIECVIRDTQGKDLQRNVINTSGDVPLRLQDRYGALRVISCDNRSCYEVSCYSYNVIPQFLTIFADSLLSHRPLQHWEHRNGLNRFGFRFEP
jgi:hypothetical protein